MKLVLGPLDDLIKQSSAMHSSNEMESERDGAIRKKTFSLSRLQKIFIFALLTIVDSVKSAFAHNCTAHMTHRFRWHCPSLRQ